MNITTGDPLQQSTTKKQHATPGVIGDFFKGLLDRLQWPTPVWVMAPASLALAFIITYGISINLSTESANQPQLIAFQDNPVLTFQQTEAPAGSIGFFHGTQTRSEPYSAMDIQLPKQNTLSFRWQAVPGTASYTLAIYVINNDEHVLLAEQTTTQSSLELENMLLIPGNHYAWKLTGKTQQGLPFFTEGDFIYHQPGKG